MLSFGPVTIADRAPRIYFWDGVIEDGESLRSRVKMLRLRSSRHLFADFGSDYGACHRASLARRYGARLALLLLAEAAATLAVGWTWPAWVLLLPAVIASGGTVTVSATLALGLAPFFGPWWWLPPVTVMAGVMHERLERTRIASEALPRWGPIRMLPLREKWFLMRSKLRFKVVITLDLVAAGFPVRAGVDVEALLHAIGERAPGCRSMLLFAKATIAFENNEHDRALLIADSARQAAEAVSPGPRAWVTLGVARLLADLGDRTGARSMARLAMDLVPARSHGLRFEVCLRYALLSAEAGQRDVAVAALHQARLISVRRRDLFGMVATEIELLRLADVPVHEQTEVVDWLCDLVRGEYKMAIAIPPVVSAVVEALAGQLAHERRDIDAAVDHMARAAAGFHLSRQVVAEAMVLATFADLLAGDQPIAHISDGPERRLEDCLDFASYAIETFQAVRYALPTSHWRQSWIRRQSDVYDLALRKAHESGQHARVAALVELSKSQAVPLPLSGRAEIGHDLFDVLLDARAAVVAEAVHPEDRGPDALDVLRALVSADPVHPVAVPVAGGEPALSDQRVTGTDVDEVVETVGGPDVFYFTAATTGRHYVWAVRYPSGQWTSGVTDLSDWEGTCRPVDDLLDALPLKRPEETRIEYVTRVGRSILSNNDAGDEQRAAETAMLSAAGAALLPSALVRALRAARSTGTIPRLLASMPGGLSAVPSAFLGVDDEDTRLIEITDLQLLPSIELVPRASDLEIASGEESRPLLVAGAFALPWVHRATAPPGAITVVDERTPPAQRRSRLLAALFERETRIGTAYLSGHLDSGTHGTTPNPLAAGLQLATEEDCAAEDERFLTVRDILSAEGRLPERVLLFACATLGVHDGGAAPTRDTAPPPALSRWPLTGEWVGYAAACLLAGASVVVCTIFDQPDDSGAAMDHAIADELESCPDPVRGLGTMLRRAIAERRAGKPGRALTAMCYQIISLRSTRP